MSTSNHSLDQLRTLQAIVRRGSFAAAARELHCVPSAVSYTIRALEDGLGLTLFDRSGHRAVLTEAGRRVLEAASPVLDGAVALDRLASQLRAGWEGQLRVVVDGVLPLGPVLAALSGLGRRSMPTRVQLEVEYQSGVQARFRQLGADLMLVLEHEPDSDHHAEPLPELPMRVLASATHPLVSRLAVQRDELSEHTELVVKDSAPRFAENPRESWFSSRRVVHLSDFHAKRLALLAGVGFGWMPLHLVRGDLAAGALVPLDLAEASMWTYRPQIVRRRDSPPGRAGTLFLEGLRQSLGAP